MIVVLTRFTFCMMSPVDSSSNNHNSLSPSYSIIVRYSTSIFGFVYYYSPVSVSPDVPLSPPTSSPASAASSQIPSPTNPHTQPIYIRPFPLP